MGAWMNRVIREAEARGRQEGIEVGRQQAAAGVLRRVLQRRFGPLSAAHEDRLQHASFEEVELLLERSVGAGSIDEVFAG